MRPLEPNEKETLARSLEEDIGSGDVTSSILDDLGGKAVIIAEEECIVSGLEVLDHLFSILDVAASVPDGLRSGTAVGAGKAVMEVEGPVKGILGAERTALNILSRMSGIATLSRQAQDLVEEASPGTRVAGTRKTTPGFYLFEKRALADGGALPHRMDLSQMAMLKDNHIEALGGGEAGIRKGIRKLRDRFGPYEKIEVEVESLGEGLAALEEGADIIMLDNMTPEECARVSKELRKRAVELSTDITLEASGGITLSDLEKYAPHVDVISMGMLTYGADPVSFKLEMR